ncbi:sensor histidine kinase [Clostridium sp. CX1]|uniref:sensor histidine kinase n=1 Tax=Clostridium sp. CX1 TaxID=2978346 RepID=UPI0021C23EEA|nr:sensor histidine kinase [Clostridium sp. CX1]MCT8975930.1 sensor histidine kinase [Clostridium sp. CX1]
MKLFLKDNKGYIFTYLLGLALTIIYSSLKGFIEAGEIIYIFIFNTVILFSFLAFRYYKNRQLYRLLGHGVSSLNDAFTELGGSELSENVSEILKKLHNLYKAEIEKGNKLHRDHLRFINQWIHQMKTPLSVIQLQLQQYEGEEEFEEMQEEVIRLNAELNMAMYFARLSSFQKDLLVERVNLKRQVLDTVNEEKKSFIKNGIIPRVEIDEDMQVYTDGKWLKFVLKQLIVNGIKYSKGKGKELIIKAEGSRLTVIDYGIGIPKKDIKRVFDPFFTGENGRKYGESTGMGLYITKKVCKSLGHEVEIESLVDEGTTVTIKFKN